MMSQHQTNDHDIDGCSDCVVYLRKNHKLSRALTASRRRRARKDGTVSTAANIESYKKEAEDKESSFAFKKMRVKSETNDGLNDDLIDMHMDMQLLSSLCHFILLN